MRPRPVRVRLSSNKFIARPGMVPIPDHLRPTQKLIYPSDNTTPFEKWYMEAYRAENENERLYLPIQWTALYCNNNFGKCHKTKLHIQHFLDNLDRENKYYTIVQYDDGILNNINNLDIKVFAMSGPRIDYPLPLLCTPHAYKFNDPKDIFASFVGRVTHPIRAKMIDQLKDVPGYYISTREHSLREYCNIMARSKYALCPRGYGANSFRICEAVQYDAIPIYISDDFILPYDNIRCGVILFDVNVMPCTVSEFLHVTNVNHSERFNEMQASKSLFTYEGCKAEILKELDNENA